MGQDKHYRRDFSGWSFEQDGWRQKGWSKLMVNPYLNILPKDYAHKSEIFSSAANTKRYSRNFQTVPDITQDFSGPPCRNACRIICPSKTEWLLFVPCDVPTFPLNLTEAFLANAAGQRAVLPVTLNAGIRHFVCWTVIWFQYWNLSRKWRQEINDFLSSDWRKSSIVQRIHSTFSNLNTPEDVSHWKANHYDIFIW